MEIEDDFYIFKFQNINLKLIKDSLINSLEKTNLDKEFVLAIKGKTNELIIISYNLKFFTLTLSSNEFNILLYLKENDKINFLNNLKKIKKYL